MAHYSSQIVLSVDTNSHWKSRSETISTRYIPGRRYSTISCCIFTSFFHRAWHPLVHFLCFPTCCCHLPQHSWAIRENVVCFCGACFFLHGSWVLYSFAAHELPSILEASACSLSVRPTDRFTCGFDKKTTAKTIREHLTLCVTVQARNIYQFVHHHDDDSRKRHAFFLSRCVIVFCGRYVGTLRRNLPVTPVLVSSFSMCFVKLFVSRFH